MASHKVKRGERLLLQTALNEVAYLQGSHSSAARCSSFSSSGDSEWPVSSLSGQFPEIKSHVSFKGKVVSVIEILSAGCAWKNFAPYRYLREK